MSPERMDRRNARMCWVIVAWFVVFGIYQQVTSGEHAGVVITANK